MKSKKLSRRDFISRIVAGAGAGAGLFTLTPANRLPALTLANSLLAPPPRWPKDVKNFRVHVIGDTHIDPVWLWPWQEGVSVVLGTFRSALDRMNETSSLTFSSGSAQFYQWVADNDPAMLDEIRRRISEGRWEVTTGWWVEPDMNIPSGEAMVRQGLYGQRMMERLLGIRTKTFYSADAFGQAGTLPQILRLQGMDNFMFTRPGHNEKKLPFIFWWETPDGSRVLASRALSGFNLADTDGKDFFLNAINHARQLSLPFMAIRHGIGDHGGGPTIRNIRAINALMADKDSPQLFYSTYDRFFEELRSAPNQQYPVVTDDLQHHAVGCYTSEVEIKKHNRRSETSLVTAEKITAAGEVCWGAHCPKERFEEAWKRVLFQQFHDSLAGSSLNEHSLTARDSYGYACDVANEAMYMALQKLEWQISTAEDSCFQYIVAFNPHAWEVKSVIEYQWGKNAPWTSVEETFCDMRPADQRTPLPACVYDDSGRLLPHQWTLGQSHSGNEKATALVMTTLPPLGYRQIREKNEETPYTFTQPARAANDLIENEYLRVTFAKDGAIGILDKETNQTVFVNGERGCRAIVIDDPYDTWGHDVTTFDKEIGAFGNASLELLEEGSLRATMRTISRYGQSTLTIDWSLISGMRRIEARVALDWHERQKMLKFSFPVDVETPEATYETPYGYIVRETNGNEEPGQRWIDLTGQCRDGRPYGLTVVNDAKYGYSVSGNDMRISVTRSTVYAQHDPTEINPQEKRYVWMDQGIQTFRMWLAPHKGSWKEINVPRMAEEFSAPPLLIYQGIHRGTMPKSNSFMIIDSPNIIASAIKKSEDGNDLIIRLVETFGEAVATTVRFPSAGFDWRGAFRPCEIKTLRIDTKTGEIGEVNLLEESS